MVLHVNSDGNGVVKCFQILTLAHYNFPSICNVIKKNKNRVFLLYLI